MKNKIPTFIGLIFLVASLAAGVLLVRNTTLFRLGASPESAPSEVRITNITDSSFTATWSTGKESLGLIKYGENPSDLNQTKTEGFEIAGSTHTLTTSGLKPKTKYYFKITSGGTEYDNNGTPWEISTGPTIASNIKQTMISGTIVGKTGQPVERAIVMMTVAGSSPLSTVTSKNGTWVIPLTLARNSDLTSYLLIDEASSLIEISVNAGITGVASALVYPQSAKPVPTITIGSSNDFRNNPPSTSDGTPEAELIVPNQTERQSSFDTGDTTPTTTIKTVTLESLREGEKVSSDKPQFFGEGPSGTTLSITVESENPQTAEVKVPTNGDWNWTPPENLTPGSHTVTITWRDAAGILRKLTRTFVVEASENPAFTATPSATLTTTPTTTITPTVTRTLTVTPTATRTITPTTTITETIPETGTLTPTIILFMMGVGIIIFASIVWKNSEINA